MIVLLLLIKAFIFVESGFTVIIDESKSINIDFDVIEIIEEFEVIAQHRDIDLTIIERERKGVKNQVHKMEFA